MLKKLTVLADDLYEQVEKLERSISKIKGQTALEKSKYFEKTVLKNMASVRKIADELETLVGKKYWAIPTYAEILYSVKY